MASLSLDLDNQWSYMKIHGDDGWESFPSYLDVLAPRALDVLARHDLRITFFVVGQDAALPENHDALGALVGGRPRDRQPLVPPRALAAPLLRGRARRGAGPGRGRDRGRDRRAHRRVPRPGLQPLDDHARGARAPRATRTTRRRCPPYIGPLARAYYFRTAKLTAEQRAERELLFGTWADGRRAVRPYRWAVGRAHAARAAGHDAARAARCRSTSATCSC